MTLAHDAARTLGKLFAPHAAVGTYDAPGGDGDALIAGTPPDGDGRIATLLTSWLTHRAHTALDLWRPLHHYQEQGRR